MSFEVKHDRVHDRVSIDDIIQSPEAARMRDMVTKGFYDQSRIGLWMFEVIGREYDDIEELSRLLRYEAFPQTCTWSIDIWEFICDLQKPDDLPDDEELALQIRRARLMAKRWMWPPVNPARTEAVLSALTGYEVNITENVTLNTFRVEVVGDTVAAENGFMDFREAVRTLRIIKQSHLSFEFYTLLTTVLDDIIVRIAGVVWGAILETRLPAWAPPVDYEQTVHVMSVQESITSTELRPYTHTLPAYVQTEESGLQPASIKLADGEIVDMVLKMDTSVEQFWGEI